MNSGENSQKPLEGEVVPEYRTREEMESHAPEGPRAFMARQEAEYVETMRKEMRDHEARVTGQTEASFIRFANNGDALSPALSDFSKNVSERKLGRIGTSHKGYGFRIDPSGRKPEKR